MRSDKVIRNGVWGSVLQLVTIFLGFVGRTVFIKCLGSDYLGITGLFTNILTIFSLSELGFSTAVSFHLYKKLAENNEQEIAGIMNFYRRVYFGVAFLILILGMVIVPFLQFIVKESMFDINYIRIVYVIYVLKTVSSYFYSYNFTLAFSDQKNYILTKIDIVTRVVISIANIIVLVVTHNYLVYLVVEILIGIFGNYIKTIVIRKEYPYLKNKKAEISRQEKQKIWNDVKNIFAGKVSTVVITSTDNILISSIINIATVGLYSNYSMIISYVQTFLTQFTTATQASLGNMFAKESKEYSYTTVKRLTIILYFATSFCSVSLAVLLNPFITLWIGEKYLLEASIVGICVINFYIQIIKTPLWFAISGLGYFKEDRNIAIYGAVSNLIVSIIAAKTCGLFGIFFGTCFSQLTQWLMKAILFCEKYLERKPNEYLLLIGKLSLYTVMITFLTWLISSIIHVENSYLLLFIKAFICLLVPNFINYLLFRNTDEFSYLIKTLKRFIKRG